MAWDDFNRDGRKGMSGDKPIDELALSLGRIALAYEDRFDRKPTVDEVLHALQVVINASPEDYFSDPVQERITIVKAG